MSDSSDQNAAMEPLRAPAGRDVVDRVTAERLGQPRLHAVDSPAAPTADAVADLEAQLTEERAARKEADAAANEMAVLVARVRTELADAKATADQLATLLAQEHQRSRKLEEDLRVAWGQVPMIEQGDLPPVKQNVIGRALRRAR
jgi:hypothetical protein